jgi:hypothetical protein
MVACGLPPLPVKLAQSLVVIEVSLGLRQFKARCRFDEGLAEGFSEADFVKCCHFFSGGFATFGTRDGGGGFFHFGTGVPDGTAGMPLQ